MSWRKHDTHAAETKAVKAALTKAGYRNPVVRHGTGTAWGWLKAKVEVRTPRECHCDIEPIGRCRDCRDKWETEYRRATRVILRTTGRHGDYDGNVNVDVVLV